MPPQTVIDLMNIKHLSFDVWSTLIEANPSFNKERIKLLYENYNPNRMSLDEVSRLAKDVRKEISSCESIGRTYQSIQRYAHILFRLGNKVDGEILNTLYNEVETILFKNMPVLYHPKTLASLRVLHKIGFTISILSNTGLVSGNMLHKILEKLGITPYLSFECYSDYIGYPKPNVRAFDDVYTQSNALPLYNNNLSKLEILHVGDNLITDVNGAGVYGFQSYWINGTSGNIIVDLVHMLSPKSKIDL